MSNKTQKISSRQLVEEIKDTIYEVLEEEIELQIEKAEKTKKLNENKKKANQVKKLKEAKAVTKAKRKIALLKLEEKKKALKGEYEKLQLLEKKLSKGKK